MAFMNRKLFVSATDTGGGFTGRGQVSEGRALEVLDAFVAGGARGRAVFMVISDHDGRIELRNRPGGLMGTVTAQAARGALLGGMLPAREAMAWRVQDLTADEAGRIVSALYRLSAGAFRAQVGREMTE